jgi:DNA-binding NarL/FixJ family response regulator
MSTPYDTHAVLELSRFHRPPRVLVADDHPLFVQALCHALTDWQFDVLEPARNGAEAVEIAGRDRPDVVLMDIHMPFLDGIRATRRVRAISPGTRVVAITSDDAPAISAAARDACASIVLLKTCAPDNLLDAVPLPTSSTTGASWRSACGACGTGKRRRTRPSRRF